MSIRIEPHDSKRFNIGDIVEANEKSNDRYVVTTKNNGFVGRVIGNNHRELMLETVSAFDMGVMIGDRFSVQSPYFDLKRSALTEDESYLKKLLGGSE